MKIKLLKIIITWRIDLSKLANKLRRASDELTEDKDHKLERECVSVTLFVRLFQFSSAVKLVKRL